MQIHTTKAINLTNCFGSFKHFLTCTKAIGVIVTTKSHIKHVSADYFRPNDIKPQFLIYNVSTIYNNTKIVNHILIFMKEQRVNYFYNQMRHIFKKK